VVVNGAPATPVVPTQRTAREQLAALVGDPDRVAEVMASLRFDPDRQQIPSPLLLLHGGLDPLASYPDQEPFLKAAAAGTLRTWPDGEHTIYNHAAERDAYTADWFTDVLDIPPPPG